MSGDEVLGGGEIHSKPRSSRKKKKASRKAKRTFSKRHPALLLHKIHGPCGSGIRKKICTLCKENKWLKDYYITHKPGRGKSYKSECKTCSEQRKSRIANQKALKKKARPREDRREYFREYFRKNYQRFLIYKKQLLERYPDYYKKKAQARRDKLKAMRISARQALHDQDFV